MSNWKEQFDTKFPEATLSEIVRTPEEQLVRSFNQEKADQKVFIETEIIEKLLEDLLEISKGHCDYEAKQLRAKWLGKKSL